MEHKDGAIREGQYEVFVRKARDAARQSLFFLYDLQALAKHTGMTALQNDADFALRQTRSLVDGVHVPTKIAQAAKQGQPASVPAATKANPTRLQRLTTLLFERDGEPEALFKLSFAAVGARETRDRLNDFAHDKERSPNDIAKRARAEIVGFWALRIWTRLHGIEKLNTELVQELVLQFQAFLRITRPRDPIEYCTMLVQKLGMLILRNCALLAGLAALIFLWTRQELSSLVLNGGTGSVLPFLLVSSGGLVTFLAGLLKRVRGKRAFFQLAFAAEEPERGVPTWPERGTIRKLLGHSEILKAVVMTLWLGFWVVILWLTGDPTQRTLFALGGLSWGLLVALHWLDLWDFIDPRPIRFLVLLGLLVFAFGVLVGRFREVGYVLFGGVLLISLGNAARKRWMSMVSVLSMLCCAATVGLLLVGDVTTDRSTWALQLGRDAAPMQRIAAEQWPFPSRSATGLPQPIVLVAASGGGSRAAIYTALTLQALHTDELSDLREVAENIQAIGSVSGGSLASAAYVAERVRREQTGSSMHEGWDKLVSDVSQDFLYPTLMGAFDPSSSRGEAIEEYWDEHVGLRGLTLGRLATLWQRAYAAASSSQKALARPPFPIPIFNATTLDAHAAVITPLALEAYMDRHDAKARFQTFRDEYQLGSTDQPTWVHDRDVSYPLELLNTSANPRLAQAVRASANFPFGFPLVDVHTAEPYGPQWIKDREHRVSLTDGGVLSNSGLWTLFHLLTHQRRQQELKARGVLLVVVDASKMPEYSPDRRSFASLYGAIRDQDPVAQNLHRKMFELLFQQYRDAIEIVKVDLVPCVNDNVHTTWALDRESQRKLKSSFDRVWDSSPAKAQVRKKIQVAWRALKARASPSKGQNKQQLAQSRATQDSWSSRAASMLRPPLD